MTCCCWHRHGSLLSDSSPAFSPQSPSRQGDSDSSRSRVAGDGWLPRPPPRHSIVDVLAFVGRVTELTGPLGLGSLGLQVNDLIGKGCSRSLLVRVARGEVVGLKLVTQPAVAVETIRNWSAS
jgi:hypothetical protein